MSAPARDLHFEVAGLGDDAVDYLAAWELQREVHQQVVDGEQPDTVLLLEHPPVFTAGKRTEPHERPVDPGGAPVIDVDRGGKITFHGPGQLVGYPIVRLPDHVKVVDYVRRVEEALIRACADLGVTTARVPGRSGVWLRADDARAGAQDRRASASGSAAASPCTASRSTATSTSAGTTGSSPAASPTPASPRSADELGRDVTGRRGAAGRASGTSRDLPRVGAVRRHPGLRGPTRARPAARASRSSRSDAGLGSPVTEPSPAPVTDLVIETHGLRKEFRSRARHCGSPSRTSTWRCRAGGVHGFLGPNGSGKTTTIRMLLGLARADRAATMRLFGEPVPDAPARGHGPGRRGRRVARSSPRTSPAGRTSRLLARVDRRRRRPGRRRRSRRSGSTGRDQDRYKSYSLGMKQRLAIAATLLKEPDAADPRRADQRARPGRHPRDPRDDPRPRRRRRHRAAQLAHPGRGAAGLHVGDDHRQRPDARVGQRRRAARHAARRTGSARRTPTRPRAALEAAGLRVTGERRPALLVETDRPGRGHPGARASRASG